MKALKKLAALAAGVAMLTATPVLADDNGMNGNGESVTYYDSYGTTNLAPSIALGAVTVAAIVAVLVNDDSQGSSHTHVHCTP